MFFYVREGFALQQRTEGFCETLEITSEMLNGELVIDGWWKESLDMGQTIKLSTAGQDLALTNLKLNVDF